MPMNTDDPDDPSGQVPIGGLSSARAIAGSVAAASIPPPAVSIERRVAAGLSLDVMIPPFRNSRLTRPAWRVHGHVPPVRAVLVTEHALRHSCYQTPDAHARGHRHDPMTSQFPSSPLAPIGSWASAPGSSAGNHGRSRSGRKLNAISAAAGPRCECPAAAIAEQDRRRGMAKPIRVLTLIYVNAARPRPCSSGPRWHRPGQSRSNVAAGGRTARDTINWEGKRKQ